MLISAPATRKVSLLVRSGTCNRRLEGKPVTLVAANGWLSRSSEVR